MKIITKSLVDGVINKRRNLEIILKMPLFSFKRFLQKNKDKSFNEIWQLLLKDSDLIWIKPEDIGALTDSPIIGFKGNIYWFPEYEMVNEFNVLLNHSKVEFTLVFEKNRLNFEKEYGKN